MYGIFLVLSIIFLAGLFAGLIRPQWIRLTSRKQVALVCGGGLVVFFTLFGMTAPTLPPVPVATFATSTVAAAVNHSDAVQKQQAPVVPPPAPTAPVPAPGLVTSITAPSPAVASAPAAPKAPTANVPVKGVGPCASAAVTTFSKITANYVAAYQDGKNALGTTQYADGLAGLHALAVPGSAASKFSGWKKVWSEYEPTYYNLIVKGYGTASDCYYNNKQSEPDALANWRDDMGQVDSDIGTWESDATGWQIRDTSTDKLTQDTAKITADLATVKADAASL